METGKIKQRYLQFHLLSQVDVDYWFLGTDGIKFIWIK